MDTSQTPSPGNTPNGSIKQRSRFRSKPANPLIPSKRHLPPRPPSKPEAGKSKPPTTSNGLESSNSQSHRANIAPEPTGAFVDIPIITTKQEVLNGVRQHVFRFLPNLSAKIRNVDPLDEEQFVRPVRLHRRDPHEQNESDEAETIANSSGKPIDDKERERLEIAKAEKKAEREANQAQIAPVAKQIKKKEKFRKQTEQVFAMNDSEQRATNMRLRYEEALPWHIEDFEMKNVWQGTFESALSENYVSLVETTGPNGPLLRMQPLEKWYRLSNKLKHKSLYTGDELEKRMKAKYKEPKFLQTYDLNIRRQEKEREATEKASGLFTRAGERGERIKSEEDEEIPEIAADVDDLDYDEKDDFADDEDNELFEGQDEEVTKEAEEKIKREQREANVFELKEEKDYDAEEAEEKRKADETKKLSKKVQRALMKREKNYIYEEDSEGNPYSSSSESEDSEAERIKEEEDKKEAEQKANMEKGKAADKQPSGASSKGTNTPSGRQSKHSDPLRKILKRPGSPNLSEASGSESTRKKLKKKHLVPNGSSMSRSTTPLNAPGSPASDSQRLKRPSAASSGSDGEGSDARRKVKKSRVGQSISNSPLISPNSSRPGSPGPANEPKKKMKKSKLAQGPLPTVEEVRNSIPVEGCTVGDVIGIWKGIASRPGFSDVLKAATTSKKIENGTQMVWKKPLP